MVNKKFKIIDFLQTRPLSWSAIGSFVWDKEQWYTKYILGLEQLQTPELIFGKKFADSCEAKKPLSPVTILSKMEHELLFNIGDIPMIFYSDTFDDVTLRETGEYKTGVKKWDKKRVDEHGQITLGALGNFIVNKVKPEECNLWLEWMPTQKIPKANGDYKGFDYEIDFIDPKDVRRFNTRRTTRDVLMFGVYVKQVVKEMQEYVRAHD